MKSFVRFRNGQRVLVEDGAWILPQPPSLVVEHLRLHGATQQEIQQLEKNPFNETVLAKFRKHEVR